MADDREPIAGSNESSKEKKQKKDKKDKKEPRRRYRDENDYYDDDDDANQGKCSCRKEFFCSMEGFLKLIEFVCYC